MNEVHAKDKFGAKLGMWLFLFTELLLFSGLFILYAVYFAREPESFATAARELNTFLGAANTAVLLTSSLCVALATTAIQRGNRTLTLALLAGTIGTALLFLFNKYLEWTAKFAHGIYPNAPTVKALPPGEQVFYSLYFIITGLHGVHVLVGLGLFLYVLTCVRDGKVHAEDYGLLENAGLYWHLVDLIWIFIFPLFYLIL